MLPDDMLPDEEGLDVPPAPPAEALLGDAPPAPDAEGVELVSESLPQPRTMSAVVTMPTEKRMAGMVNEKCPPPEYPQRKNDVGGASSGSTPEPFASTISKREPCRASSLPEDGGSRRRYSTGKWWRTFPDGPGGTEHLELRRR